MTAPFTIDEIRADVIRRYEAGEPLGKIDAHYGRGRGWSGNMVSRVRLAGGGIKRRSAKPTKPRTYSSGGRDIAPGPDTPSPEKRAKRSVDWRLAAKLMRGVS